MSKTIILLKKKKPVAKDHRSIALTNGGCIVFIRIVEGKIVENIDTNGLIREMQAGRMLEENLFIVRYCIEEMHRMPRRSWW